jgi:hypothetical protein
MIQAISEQSQPGAIYASNLRTRSTHYIEPTLANPATVLFSDDDGGVVIRFEGSTYLVQSIDLEYPE